jgi:hypothetical protein
MAEPTKKKTFSEKWKRFYSKNKGLVIAGAAAGTVGLLYLVYRAGKKKNFNPSGGGFDTAAVNTGGGASTSTGGGTSTALPAGGAVVSGQFPLVYQSKAPYTVVFEVQQLQKALNTYHGAGLNPDGKFGDGTRNALARLFPNLDSTRISETTYRQIISGGGKSQVVSASVDRTYLDGLIKILERDKATLATLKREFNAAGFNIAQAAVKSAEIAKLEKKIAVTQSDIDTTKAKLGLSGLDTEESAVLMLGFM